MEKRAEGEDASKVAPHTRHDTTRAPSVGGTGITPIPAPADTEDAEHCAVEGEVEGAGQGAIQTDEEEGAREEGGKEQTQHVEEERDGDRGEGTAVDAQRASVPEGGARGATGKGRIDMARSMKHPRAASGEKRA